MVALGTDRMARPVGRVHDAVDLAALLDELRPDVVAIDSPRAWAGTTRRGCEEELSARGVSVFTTELTIDQDETTSVTAAVPEVIDAALASIADDDEITIDIVGAGTGAQGLIVTLIGDVAALESS